MDQRTRSHIVATEPCELRTARLVLRPFRREDVDAVFAFQSDEMWQRFLHFSNTPYTQDNAERFVQRRLEKPWTEQPHWGIDHEGELVGDVLLVRHPEDAIAELGYSVAPEWRSHGFATEAASAVLDYGFGVCQLVKLHGEAAVENVASCRVMEALGMVREGVLRHKLALREGRSDSAYYGMLREEWEIRR